MGLFSFPFYVSLLAVSTLNSLVNIPPCTPGRKTLAELGAKEKLQDARSQAVVAGQRRLQIALDGLQGYVAMAEQGW